MRTISIILGDNDFGNTFKPLLESVFKVIQYHGEMDKKTIVEAIYFAIPYFYFSYQHKVGENSSETIKHLQIIEILFDEEAEADILYKDHNHGAWYLELQTGNVYSY